jgi:hypothetical protein
MEATDERNAMQIMVDGLRIAPCGSGWILERCIPAHAAEKSTAKHAIGELVPERWITVRYPGDLRSGLADLYEAAVRASGSQGEGAAGLREAVREWDRIRDLIDTRALELAATLDGAKP